MDLQRKNRVIAVSTIVGVGAILCAIAGLVVGWKTAVIIGVFFIVFLPILWLES